VTVTATVGTLTANTYTGTITLSATGAANITVPVTFTVTAAAALNVSPTSLSFTATQGAANPPNQSLSVTSNTLWTVNKDTNWLTVSPTSGSNNGTVIVSVNTASAIVGTNSGTITVTGGGMTRTVTVILTLNAPSTSSAFLTWNPNTETTLASYRVYQSTAQGVYGAAIATVPSGITSYTATGLQVGNTYYFTVTAVDSNNNESQPSNEVNKSIF